MKVIGITGTNGKTTTTHVVAEILTKAGYKVGKIGTLTGRLTTPSPWELAELFDQFKAEQTDYVVMEVSSHGIHQDRIKGIYYHVKALTNITQDHLDYHKTFKEYRQVKLGWMARGSGIKIVPEQYYKEIIDFEHPYLGHFNEQNIKLSYAIVKALNAMSIADLKKHFKTLSFVPGRFEVIDQGQPFHVVVDYAHTPDGLQNIIDSAKDILKRQKLSGRLITVFGCGGDRDRGKRPKMGAIAYKNSAVTIVTSDNPRTEQPEAIIDEIFKGIHQRWWQRKQVVRMSDRAHAIERAIQVAMPNDIVVLAGKGHETYQVVGAERVHFDDREEARKQLALKGYKKA